MSEIGDLGELARRARQLAPGSGTGTGSELERVGTAGTQRGVEPGAPTGPDRGPVPRIGLVLSGGGAKGAYHVGVLEYLASVGTRLHAIAGASIGALNGAVIAGSDSLDAAAAHLAEVWDEVGRLGPAGSLSREDRDENTLEQLARLPSRLTHPAVSPQHLERLVAEHVDPGRLRTGTPIWVSAFPAVEGIDPLNRWGWAVDVVRSRLGASVEWLHLNGLSDHDCRQAVLASAALPLILPPRRLNGRLYRDGGLADNTPAGALVRHAGCDIVIVVHLSRGSTWDAHDFPGTSMIEIRPRRPLAPAGPGGDMTGMLDFSPHRLRRLRAQGRADTAAILDPLAETLHSVTALRSAEAAMLTALDGLDE
ncbi:patatin-like phospholipase family protein [Streptacidiphilus sp. N1-10]|uniref:Patatin-like phospholipase family protein n=1 Tax=Streptacidiphilus jeojiensis TaxID=3229225 RepID=A0ABV6XGE2_9ACTN